MNITITAAAEKFMRRMVRFGGVPGDAGFRLTVAPGGCSGYSSEFAVEAQPHPGDATLDVHGLRLFLPAPSRLLLEGATVDFTDTPVASGLTFVLPQAGSCGTCATSAPAGPAVATVEISRIARRA